MVLKQKSSGLVKKKCHPLQTLRHLQLPMVPITEDSVGIAHMVPGNANLHLGSNTRAPALTTMYPSEWASRAPSREVRICDPTVRNRRNCHEFAGVFTVVISVFLKGP